MRKNIILAGLFLFLGGLTISSAVAKSGCIICHTDEGKLKSLFKPRDVSASEGEG